MCDISRLRVNLDIVRRQPKSGKVTQRLQFDVSKGPSTLRNARDDVTLRRSNCWIARCAAFPAAPVVVARGTSGGR